MFRSRQIRRRDRSHRTHARRLGVELMEGRMMLSASGFEASLPGLDMSQVTFRSAQISLAGAHVAFFTQPTDGGYVNSDAFILSGDTIGGHGTSVAGTISLDYGVARQDLYGVMGQDVNVFSPQPFTNGAGYTVSLGQAVYGDQIGNPQWLTDNLLLSGPGLQPQVIPAWSDTVAPATNNIQPIVVGPNPTLPSVSEGGSIPIHAIFADFRKDAHLASGVKTAPSPSAETSVDSLSSARRASTTDNAIAGEWARAMVFEIAGGEPTSSDSHSPSDKGETLQHSEPFSSVETPQNAMLADRHAAMSSNEGPPVGKPVQPQATQLSGQTAAAMAQLAAGMLAADSSATLGVPQLFAESRDVTALAAAVDFDALGEENAAAIISVADGKSWLRSIGTSPLLMVLALERIAALNSRRATRESRIAATKKPLRSPR